MFKHVGLLLLLSFAALFLMRPLKWVIAKTYELEIFLTHKANLIVANGVTAHIIKQIIILTITPLIIAAIPALFYWLSTHKTLPYLANLIWGLWLALIIIIAAHG